MNFTEQSKCMEVPNFSPCIHDHFPNLAENKPMHGEPTYIIFIIIINIIHSLNHSFIHSFTHSFIYS